MKAAAAYNNNASLTALSEQTYVVVKVFSGVATVGGHLTGCTVGLDVAGGLVSTSPSVLVRWGDGASMNTSVAPSLERLERLERRLVSRTVKHAMLQKCHQTCLSNKCKTCAATTVRSETSVSTMAGAYRLRSLRSGEGGVVLDTVTSFASATCQDTATGKPPALLQSPTTDQKDGTGTPSFRSRS